MLDFENYWQWLHKEYPGVFTKEVAYEHYNKFYFCDCATCEYRKEHGLVPSKITPGCKLTLLGGIGTPS